MNHLNKYVKVIVTGIKTNDRAYIVVYLNKPTLCRPINIF